MSDSIKEQAATAAARTATFAAALGGNGDRPKVSPERIDIALRDGQRGIANLHAELVRGLYVYDTTEKQVLIFNGVHYVVDENEDFFDSLETIKAVFDDEYVKRKERAQVDEDKSLKQLQRVIKQLGGKKFSEEILRIAVKGSNRLAVWGSVWDRCSGFLPVANGKVCLETGRLLPGKPADFIRTVAPFVYDPDAKCPHFREYLLASLDDDKEKLGFVQRFLGYSVRGVPDMGKFLLLFGPHGHNGKTTLFTGG